MKKNALKSSSKTSKENIRLYLNFNERLFVAYLDIYLFLRISNEVRLCACVRACTNSKVVLCALQCSPLQSRCCVVQREAQYSTISSPNEKVMHGSRLLISFLYSFIFSTMLIKKIYIFCFQYKVFVVMQRCCLSSSSADL